MCCVVGVAPVRMPYDVCVANRSEIRAPHQTSAALLRMIRRNIRESRSLAPRLYPPHLIVTSQFGAVALDMLFHACLEHMTNQNKAIDSTQRLSSCTAGLSIPEPVLFCLPYRPHSELNTQPAQPDQAYFFTRAFLATISFRFLPALNAGTVFAGTEIRFCVCGLMRFEALRARASNFPNPVRRTSSRLRNASETSSTNASTANLDCFLVNPDLAESLFTNSPLFNLSPPFF